MDYKWAVYEWPESGVGTLRPYLLRFTVARYDPTYKTVSNRDPILLRRFTSFKQADDWAKGMEEHGGSAWGLSAGDVE